MMNKKKYAEGGSMLVPPEMALEEEESMMPPEEPVDTFTPEEQATASEEQLPDDEMEGAYLETVLGQSLDETEQEYLIEVLGSDPRLAGYAQGGLLGDPYGMPMQNEEDAVEESMLRANRMPSLMGNRQ
jgi:hypothetical protein